MNQTVLNKLTLLRQELHRYPELSGEEKSTAKKIVAFFEPLNMDEMIYPLGGEGVAFVYDGQEDGPTTLIRCELDGLPIFEDNDVSYKSNFSGRSHTCGHDGHMAIVCGVGLALAEGRPKKGRVTLLFQPAEETGEGAKKILEDAKFSLIKPDYAFALHNLPGDALNDIIFKDGAFAAASRGLEIQLMGRTSHAAYPEDGNSPADAMSKIILGLQKLPKSLDGFSMVTVVNAVLGEISFGTTPGQATIRATLRAYEDKVMDQLVLQSEELVAEIASRYNISFTFNYTECFNSTANHPEASAYMGNAALILNLKTSHRKVPFRWSEDFGQFSQVTKTGFFGIGAGLDHAQLHESVYDFPDEIIPTGVEMFMAIIKQINY